MAYVTPLGGMGWCGAVGWGEGWLLVPTVINGVGVCRYTSQVGYELSLLMSDLMG